MVEQRFACLTGATRSGRGKFDRLTVRLPSLHETHVEACRRSIVAREADLLPRVFFGSAPRHSV